MARLADSCYGQSRSSDGDDIQQRCGPAMDLRDLSKMLCLQEGTGNACRADARVPDHGEAIRD